MVNHNLNIKQFEQPKSPNIKIKQSEPKTPNLKRFIDERKNTQESNKSKMITIKSRCFSGSGKFDYKRSYLKDNKAKDLMN